MLYSVLLVAGGGVVSSGNGLDEDDNEEQDDEMSDNEGPIWIDVIIIANQIVQQLHYTSVLDYTIVFIPLPW